MTDISKDAVEWSRYIWAEERGEHDFDARHVFHVESTVPRWEGDRDKEFHRYVDHDIYESAEKYHAQRYEALAAENQTLRARVEYLNAAALEQTTAIIKGAPVTGDAETVERAILQYLRKDIDPQSHADDAALQDMASGIYAEVAAALPPQQVSVADAAKVLMRLRMKDVHIEAAMLGHYGKHQKALTIYGADLTANGKNWTFKQGFSRMFRAYLRALTGEDQ